MSLRLLWIFKTVCECRTITEAAKQLYMSQPAVTNAIKELEEQTSLHLFDRIGKRIYLNDSGKYYYQKVCKLLTMVEELEQSTKAIQEHPTLRIGSSITNATLLVPKILQEFQKEWKGHVQVIVQNAATIETKILNNEIDMAFLEGAIHSNQLIQVPLFSYELQTFCGITYPLSNDVTYSLSDLKDEQWLLREKGSAIRDCFDSAMLLQDIVVNPLWESVNSQVLIQAAIANLGIGVLPKQLLTSERKAQTIQILSTQEPLACMNHVVYHKDKHIHSSMQELLSLCEGYKAENA